MGEWHKSGNAHASDSSRSDICFVSGKHYGRWLADKIWHDHGVDRHGKFRRGEGLDAAVGKNRSDNKFLICRWTSVLKFDPSWPRHTLLRWDGLCNKKKITAKNKIFEIRQPGLSGITEGVRSWRNHFTDMKRMPNLHCWPIFNLASISTLWYVLCGAVLILDWYVNTIHKAGNKSVHPLACVQIKRALWANWWLDSSPSIKTKATGPFWGCFYTATTNP